MVVLFLTGTIIIMTIQNMHHRASAEASSELEISVVKPPVADKADAIKVAILDSKNNVAAPAQDIDSEKIALAEKILI
ncbi:hypothetical protein NADFUDRAFT_83395 [Nadsonia fulvescens var. elongata DSM 6958]|uniref:Uncharacterized protein n=1 Tax=Nadsonia fulvescens var. elongata DSM 6958 TaxID=857566 RepID=A0A1E3PJN3_9ASCO|nr:hypothetical protein NADFUDRAFT_83395 [Nadsonia fulvescens var. elongata DSM 6958]